MSFLNAVNAAITLGYGAKQVLTHVSTKWKKLQNPINKAMILGYSAEQVLGFLSNQKKFKSKVKHENEFTRVGKSLGYTRPGERLEKGVKAAAIAVPLAIGGAYAAKRLFGPVQPSQVLPAISKSPPPAAGPSTINITPKTPGGGGSPRGLPAPGPATKALAAPNQPPPAKNVAQSFPPAPSAPPPSPIVPRQPSVPSPSMQRNIQMVKGLKEDTRLQNLIMGGLATSQIAGVLQKVLPKEKFNVLMKAEGGIEQLIKDYSQHLQVNPQEQIQPFSQRVQEGAPANVPQEEEASTIMMGQAPQEIPQQALIRERTQRAAFGTEDMPKALQEYSAKGKEFAVPSYRYPDEEPKDYNNRLIIQNAIKKAAHSILEGKSFLDYPIAPETLKARGGYSTAEDVLRFMAGIPNVYDPLLDDQEKDELFNALQESGDSSVEGLRPTKGERAIHGAQITPNLVWNLLLSVEPRLSDIKKPPKIKGSRSFEGQKMTGTDFKRALTHSVYGVLSGKSISTELGDKIEKISMAAQGTDLLTQAIKQGNLRKAEAEMEKLMDDEYFASLFTEEIEDMVRKFR